MFVIVLVFIRAPFYVLSVFVGMCCIFWLFWLSCQYLPSDWLEILNTLMAEYSLFVLKVPLNNKQTNFKNYYHAAVKLLLWYLG